MTAPQEHPRHGDISALLKEGLTNAAVARRLGISARTIGRVRRDAQLPPAPRSAWARGPHPKDGEIRALLGEGHTDAEIGRRTGTDVSTVARIRKAGGYGPATIIRRGVRVHPKDAQIRELLAQARSTAAIARELGVDRAAVRRIRAETGIPNPPQHTQTLEEKWTERTRPVDGGHLEWTGERATVSGTPVMRFHGETYTAGVLAFRKRTGRDPVGPVVAECDMPQCVAPEHVEDAPGRKQLREQLRYLLGKGERPPFCRHGHDQAEHGRYLRDGTAYCEACSKAKRTRNEVGAS